MCSCGAWIYDAKKSQFQYCSGCGKPWTGPGAQGKALEASPPHSKEVLDRVLEALPEDFRSMLYSKFPALSPKPEINELRKAADAAHKEHKQAAERKIQMETKSARLRRELEEALSQLDSAAKEAQDKTTEYKRKWALYEQALAEAEAAGKKPTPEGVAGKKDKEGEAQATASTAAGGEEDASMGEDQATAASGEQAQEEEPSPTFAAFMAELEPGKREMVAQEMERAAKRQRVKGVNQFKEALEKQVGGMGASAAGGQQQG